MKIMSFGWTAAALVVGEKTVTRRDWKDSHAAKFKAGDIVQAYDKAPFAGGKRIGYIQLTADPVKLPMDTMPACDYLNEGFAYLHEHPELIPASMPIDVSEQGFIDWRNSGGEKWVVRFILRKEWCFDCGSHTQIGCLCFEAEQERKGKL